jgi:ribokinase
MRFAAVGHVEWVEFARVARVPTPGQIVQAEETWQEPAGSGAVAAVQLAKLAGSALFFTALGDDELGHAAKEQLTRLGLTVEAVFREKPQRRAFAFVDEDGERTITTIGERYGPSGEDPLAWTELAGADAVYFVSGDASALRTARAARVLVATARSLSLLANARVQLDALVHSSKDLGEAYARGEIDPPPRLVVSTAGSEGGSWTTLEGRSGSYDAVPVPGHRGDAYGAGDSFAAGLTFGLGEGREVEDALSLASRCGAAASHGRGAYEGQLRLV